MQWYETGIFLAAALALAGFCFWWTGRGRAAEAGVYRDYASGLQNWTVMSAGAKVAAIAIAAADPDSFQLMPRNGTASYRIGHVGTSSEQAQWMLTAPC
jgi:hypothetical protein